MAGEGVALPPEEVAEVDALAAKLEAELKPSGEMGRILVRRIAAMSHRLDRCGRVGAAAREKRVRDAPKAFEDARRAEVDAIVATLASDPVRAVPRLLRTPEGIDWVIVAWLAIRGDLSRPGRVRWTEAHVDRVEHLLGRVVGMHPQTPFGPLARAAGGDFSGLSDDQGAGLERKDRKAWAREQLAALIDGEVAELRSLRELIDDEGEAADRAQAVEGALFDASKEAQLARRYESAAERTLFRALREFREIEARNEPNAAPVPVSSRPLLRALREFHRVGAPNEPNAAPAPKVPTPSARPESRPLNIAPVAPAVVHQAPPPAFAAAPTTRPASSRTNPMSALRAASLRGMG